MGLGSKFVWLVAIAAVLSGVVIIAIKVSQWMVKRRTAALLEAHGGEDGSNGTSRET